MLKKTADKTIIFILSLIFFAFFLGVIFFSEEKGEKEVIDLRGERSFLSPDYVIENSLLQVFDLSLEVPEGWSVESYAEKEMGMEIFSPSCRLYLTCYKEEDKLSHLKAYINAVQSEKIEREDIRLLPINDTKGIKRTKLGPVEFFFEEKICEIGIAEDKKACTDKLYKLTDSISF